MLFRRLHPPERVRVMSHKTVRRFITVKKAHSLRGCTQHGLRWRALRLANVAYLVVFRRARVQWPAKEQLRDHTAQRPDVDGLAEGKAKQDLGGSVVARLQIGRLHCLGNVRGRAEVDYFDLVGLSYRVDKHDVLGLEVGVDEAELLELGQRE